ncbi:MAG TPA: TIGR03086 family metal-binding protein [Ornithinimicrobium sp.]|uniref:TIGR03086 family metal-binding protein n=1 Tax=Ornithinimicrobium sp. TaxID=1977084 RepID=UPI002B48A35B|nr:TIGR03086 family metal-binding protein [Ornithinimicrobium sp.]HKJ12897.1 TIGR03086 family metal-binding protein [Ornithinimicrobium sp.]
MSGLPSEPAARHRAVTERFTAIVRATDSWDCATPVPGWLARDVVAHLVGWFPGFLASGADVRLPTGPAVEDDPRGAWELQAVAVQRLLDDPETTGRTFSNPHTGDHRLDEAIDRFYTSDVFMHTWDLARATGADDSLDAAECARMFAGMEPMADLLLASGQYGPQVPVPDDASAQDRLLGLIGRDPDWRP